MIGAMPGCPPQEVTVSSAHGGTPAQQGRGMHQAAGAVVEHHNSLSPPLCVTTLPYPVRGGRGAAHARAWSGGGRAGLARAPGPQAPHHPARRARRRLPARACRDCAEAAAALLTPAQSACGCPPVHVPDTTMRKKSEELRQRLRSRPVVPMQPDSLHAGRSLTPPRQAYVSCAAALPRRADAAPAAGAAPGQGGAWGFEAFLLVRPRLTTTADSSGRRRSGACFMGHTSPGPRA